MTIGAGQGLGLIIIVRSFHHYAGRPSNAARKERTFGKRLGIIHNEGAQWMEQRRFALRHLRDLGFGRSASSEQLIHQEIADLTREMMTGMTAGDDAAGGDGGAVVEFKGLFNLSLINILWAMTSGERFQRDDAHGTQAPARHGRVTLYAPICPFPLGFSEEPLISFVASLVFATTCSLPFKMY